MEAMETSNSPACKSVFCHQAEDLRDAFTELWIQIINEKENADNYQNVVLQTNISGL